jgi:preprotein translocase subunit SecD
MKTEDIKRMAKILQDMEEAKLKGDQHKLDVDKDGDIEADDLAKLRAKKGKKDMDEVKMVPGVVRPDGTRTSKPTKAEVGKTPEYKAIKKNVKESIEQIETELKEIEASTIDRVRHNVNNMTAALKQVWEKAVLPQKGGQTPDATMKHVSKSTHANVQNIDNLDKQLERSKGEAEFVKKHEVDVIDGEKIEGDTLDKVKKDLKKAPLRKGDQAVGDTAVVNPVKDTTKS